MRGPEVVVHPFEIDSIVVVVDTCPGSFDAGFDLPLAISSSGVLRVASSPS